MLHAFIEIFMKNMKSPDKFCKYKMTRMYMVRVCVCVFIVYAPILFEKAMFDACER